MKNQWIDDEQAEFEYDWLSRQNYEFKILTLIAVLADNNLAYRGKLKDMCEFFGVASGDSKNNRNIKAAIDKLEADGLLKQIKDGQVYTLTLSRSAEKKSRVIRIQKQWVEIAKDVKCEDPKRNVSWINLLKVWLFLINNNQNIITTSEIAAALGISTSTVKNAKHILQKELKAIYSQRKVKMVDDGCYQCLGCVIDVMAWLDD